MRAVTGVILKSLVRITLGTTLGLYMGFQSAVMGSLGHFQLVPSIEHWYYEMFMRAIDDPKVDWSQVNLGEGAGAYCTKKDMECLVRINLWVNTQIKYVSDSAQYHTPEYFAKPSETLKSRMGDCDDSAILKYALLRLNGFTIDEVALYGVMVPIGQVFPAPNHAVTGVMLNGVEYDMDINYFLPTPFPETNLVIFDKMDERWYKVIRYYWQIW